MVLGGICRYRPIIKGGICKYRPIIKYRNGQSIPNGKFNGKITCTKF